MARAKNFSVRWQLKRVNARLGVLALLATLVAAGGCANKESAPTPAPRAAAQPVRVVTLDKRGVQKAVRYVGTVRNRRQVRVTAQLPGTLGELTVEEGDRVEKDQILARIDAPDIEARKQQVRAEVRRGRTERDFACDQYATDKKLAAQKVIEQVKVDASRRRCESARESVHAARAKLEEVEATLERTVERAPVAGPVLERMAEPGEHVGPGRPLMVIGVDRQEVMVPVVETDLRRGVEVATPALVTLPTGQQIEAEISDLAPSAGGPGRAVEATVPLGTEHTGLRPGQSVDVDFVLERDEAAVAVPLDALKLTSDGAEVLFALEDGKVRQVAIERRFTAAGWVVTKTSFEPGTRVAISNLDVLADGTRVFAVEVEGGTQ